MSQNSIEQAAEKLGVSIREAPAVVAFQKAQEALEADEQAVQLLQQHAEVQARVRAAQSSGNIVASDLEELASIQQTLRARMNEYLAAQESLRSFIRQVNVQINQLLGFNFSSLARRSGCCG
jgi:cell fate (sporulation/competence/biofilm development) regulator YlbF (YheA/YmcA/DUF963 family)